MQQSFFLMSTCLLSGVEQQILVVEDEFAIRAGRAEARITAGSLDFLTFLEHGGSLVSAEQFLGLV